MDLDDRGIDGKPSESAHGRHFQWREVTITRRKKIDERKVADRGVTVVNRDRKSHIVRRSNIGSFRHRSRLVKLRRPCVKAVVPTRVLPYSRFGRVACSWSSKRKHIPEVSTASLESAGKKKCREEGRTKKVIRTLERKVRKGSLSMSRSQLEEREGRTRYPRWGTWENNKKAKGNQHLAQVPGKDLHFFRNPEEETTGRSEGGRRSLSGKRKTQDGEISTQAFQSKEGLHSQLVEKNVSSTSLARSEETRVGVANPKRFRTCRSAYGREIRRHALEGPYLL